MTLLAALSLLTWAYLLLARGRFWQSGPFLPDASIDAWPPVAVVVPARDEADSVGTVLRSLLAQDYPGPFRIVLVDDNSTDGTGDIARALGDPRLLVVDGLSRPPGWSGKLWAVHQGVAAAEGAALLLLTDADIVHRPDHLRLLVAQIERRGLDMVSEMAELACESPAERALVPAFVYFFQLLYPFAWVNDPMRATAAAAGGTILVRERALRRAGGIESVRGALIDDVALASRLKKAGPVWLGHAKQAKSIRPYPGFADIWKMIARTAYVQLRYSPVILVATTLGMALTFLAPPLAALGGAGAARFIGAAAWLAMAWTYLPTMARFGRSPLWAPLLPLVALFYMAATIGSFADYALGRGAAWKGRAYQGTNG